MGNNFQILYFVEHTRQYNCRICGEKVHMDKSKKTVKKTSAKGHGSIPTELPGTSSPEASPNIEAGQHIETNGPIEAAQEQPLIGPTDSDQDEHEANREDAMQSLMSVNEGNAIKGKDASKAERKVKVHPKSLAQGPKPSFAVTKSTAPRMSSFSGSKKTVDLGKSNTQVKPEVVQRVSSKVSVRSRAPKSELPRRRTTKLFKYKNTDDLDPFFVSHKKRKATPSQVSIEREIEPSIAGSGMIDNDDPKMEEMAENEREKARQRELEKQEKERQRLEKERENQKQKDQERERERKLEKDRKRELEKEHEKERKRDLEKLHGKERQRALEEQRKHELQKQQEKERQILLERERQQEQERQEKEQHEALERQQQELELERRKKLDASGSIVREHHFREDIFGYRSKLKKRKQGIFSTKVNSSETSSHADDFTSGGKDMTWIRDLSPSKSNSSHVEYVDGVSVFNEKEQRELEKIIPSVIGVQLRKTFSVLWWISLIAGRMPFILVMKGERTSRTLECRIDPRRRRFAIYIITSLILTFVASLSVVSFLEIYFIDENTSSDYNRAERFLLEKQWPLALLFIMTFVACTAVSWSFILNGRTKAEYFTNWSATLEHLAFDATFGLKFVCYACIVIGIIESAALLAIFVTSTPKNNAFIEAVDLVSTMIFRYFGHQPLLSPNRHNFGIVTLCIFLYGQLCLTVVTILALMLSLGTTNLANEWNLRLALILNKVKPKSNEPALGLLNSELKLKNMFLHHNKIMDLVGNLSGAVAVILFCYYATKVLVITSGLFDIALYLLRNNSDPFDDSDVRMLHYKYDKKDDFSKWQSVFVVLIPSAGFFATSIQLSKLHEAIYDGYDRARRHSPLSFNGTHEKRFLISILMKSSGANSYSLGVYSLFTIDRSFMFSFFALSVTVFSVLIQFNIPRLIDVPILFECDNGLNGICSQPVRIPRTPDAIKRLTKMSDDAVIAAAKKKAESERTTRSPISATKRPGIMTTPPPPSFPCLGMNPHNSTLPDSELYKCNGTEIIRFHVHNSQGAIIEPSNYTMDCIFNPYPQNDTIDYYDCFGNKLNVTDDCGILNFGVIALDNVTSDYPTIRKIASLIVSDATRDEDRVAYTCFHFDGIVFYANKLFRRENDTNQCGLPAEFLKTVCRTYRNTTTGIARQPKSLKEFRSAVNETELKTREGGKSCIIGYDGVEGLHAEITYNGSTFAIYSPVEARSLSDRYSLRFIVQTNRSQEIFRTHRFAYAHPDLVQGTLTLFDCPDGSLAIVDYVLDECGGVSPNRRGAGSRSGGPPVAVQVAFNGTMKTYMCYPPHPDFSTYTCGVPTQFAGEICDGWESWLKENKPIYAPGFDLTV